MFMGMIIAVYQFYCVQGKVAIPVNGSCYYTIVHVVRQEKVIPIAKITNCMYTTFPTIVLCFTYKCMPRQDHWNRVGEGEGERERVSELCDMVSVNIIINILVHINVHDIQYK